MKITNTRKSPYIYSIIALAILLTLGTLHIFERPRSKSSSEQNAGAETSERAPAQAGSLPDPRSAFPVVKGDKTFVDADPDDDLQKILDEAQPGTTVRLSDGEYKLSGLKLANSGKPNNWIKIINVEDAKPKLDFQGLGDFLISGSYVYLEGLEVYNGNKANLRIASTTRTLSNVVLKKLKIHSLKVGPGATLKIQRNNANGVGVSQVYVEDCDLSQSLPVSVVEGIGSHSVILKNNFIHTDSGYAAGVTFKGGSSRILIENNFIKGVRRNPAIVMGGRTFLNFFDPQYTDQEGVEQMARNNIIVDFDEAAVSFQGVKNASFVHNTVVTASENPVFTFVDGNTNDGSKPSKNNSIAIENNLIISRANSTVYATNDSGPIPSLKFGKQMWIGTFSNPTKSRWSLPQFPQSIDTSLPAQKAFVALEGLNWKDVVDLQTARVRFSPKVKGPVVRSTASVPDAPKDFLGRDRAETTSFGAFEE